MPAALPPATTDGCAVKEAGHRSDPHATAVDPASVHGTPSTYTTMLPAACAPGMLTTMWWNAPCTAHWVSGAPVNSAGVKVTVCRPGTEIDSEPGKEGTSQMEKLWKAADDAGVPVALTMQVGALPMVLKSHAA